MPRVRVENDIETSWRGMDVQIHSPRIALVSSFELFLLVLLLLKALCRELSDEADLSWKGQLCTHIYNNVHLS